MQLSSLLQVFRDKGCGTVYIKDLAENDNSKNQIYFGPNFGILNQFPGLQIQAANSGTKKTPIFKAKLSFAWVSDDGSTCPAEHAQLIFYPQYPEVRFSGFLLGSQKAPALLLRGRAKGRVLLLGIKPDGRILGYAAAAGAPIAREAHQLPGLRQDGVFKTLLIAGGAPKTAEESFSLLLGELGRISAAHWINSKKLMKDGRFGPCEAPHCGGMTLEAELGILPNGISEPDFMGWEVKQHHVSNFVNLDAGVLTLFTPEPTGGYYRSHDIYEFVARYGYIDQTGRPNRRNFGGIHKYHVKQQLTGLTLTLDGFDEHKDRITDSSGGLALISRDGEVAANWSFNKLMEHWNRKHANAVYVPSLCRRAPRLQYQYGGTVRAGRNTEFLMFLRAVAAGKVYYDPGIKVENLDSKPTSKKRSQFRVKSKDLSSLYGSFEEHVVSGC